jgi:hypothetical protein
MLQQQLHRGDLLFKNRLCKPKTAIFPVKIPVCREFGRRQVRSVLRPQCGSPVRTMTFPFVITGRPVLKFGNPSAENYRKRSASCSSSTYKQIAQMESVHRLISKSEKAYQLKAASPQFAECAVMERSEARPRGGPLDDFLRNL